LKTAAAGEATMSSATMSNTVKVAIFRLNEAEGERPSKVWRYKADLLESYKLAEVEKELIPYFPDIEQKKLGLVLKYQDSLLEHKIIIESDGDLRVSYSCNSKS